MLGSLRHRNATRDMSLLALSEDDETPEYKLHWKLKKSIIENRSNKHTYLREGAKLQRLEFGWRNLEFSIHSPSLFFCALKKVFYQ